MMTPDRKSIKEGEELFRVPEGTDVWFSKQRNGHRTIVTVHINPSADQIKPDWFRAGERF